MKSRWAVVAAVVVTACALVALHAGGRSVRDVEWTEVRRADLVVGVSVAGTLVAPESSRLGPPAIPDTWEFKIAELAEDGTEVRRGDPVVRFDTSALVRTLEEKRSESAAARKTIEQREADAALRRGRDELDLAEADARARKARLVAQRPDELEAARESEKARIDSEDAQRQVRFVREKADAAQRGDAVALEALRARHEAAERRVREIQETIDRMTVRAPTDGTVSLIDNWRDEKKKVGDTVWREEKIVEIPNLRSMRAAGDVDEADAGRVEEGLRVTLRLDAHPEIEYTGRVASVWGAVQRRSWRDPVKVVRVDVALDATDMLRMRPGMRFRGTIERERYRSRLVVPIEAVFQTADGPLAFRKTALGHEAVRLEVGRTSDTLVEVLEGLREGDRIARRNFEAQDEGRP
jgi:multidrug efflux pump subunit AcrA (membrane-fusion protein)